jgi:phage shock protein A
MNKIFEAIEEKLVSQETTISLQRYEIADLKAKLEEAETRIKALSANVPDENAKVSRRKKSDSVSSNESPEYFDTLKEIIAKGETK